MNKKVKFGLSLATAGALMLSSVAAFAGTATSGTGFKGHDGILQMMLNDGVVTQTQIDTYEKKMQTQRDAQVKEALQALVTKGTLTQAKADAVVSAMAAEQAEREALKTKLEGMTEEAVKAYFEANKETDKKPGLGSLVDAGTLTSDELKAVQNAIGMGGHGPMGGPEGGMRDQGDQSTQVNQEERATQTKSAIQALVTKGTLTQAKADAVTTAIAADQAEREALKTKLDGMTQAQVKEYFEANKDTSKTSNLSTLVTNGTLTADELKAVQSAIGMGGHGPNGDMKGSFQHKKGGTVNSSSDAAQTN